MKTVEFRVTERPVVNPYRGWVVYGDPQKYDFIMDRVGIGYQRFTWAAIEPEEGVYNWEPVEQFLSAYAALGKQGAFGILFMSSGSKQDLFPEYLKRSGADLREIKYFNNIGLFEKVSLTPCHDDPVFFDKLTRLMSAVAAKYDGDPRVAFIDIRSLGNWGEGHSILFKNPAQRRETVRMHFDMHHSLFKKTDLVIPWGEEQYQDIYEEFIDRGLGIRRDGIMGNATATETLYAMGKAPGVFEFWGDYRMMCHYNWFDGGKTKYFNYSGYTNSAIDTTNDLAYYFPKETQGWWPKGNEVHAWHCGGNSYQESILNGRPTFIPLGFAKDSELLWNERRPFVERWTNELGYAFLMEAACFDDAPAGNALSVKAMWKNHGVSMLYKPAYPELVLVDQNGNVAASRLDGSLNLKKIYPRSYREMDTALPLDGVKAGEYALYIGVGRPGEMPLPGQPLPAAFIETVSDGETLNRWLRLGGVTVRR